MSTQSIIHKTNQDLLDDVDKIYMCLANKFMLKRRFAIGNSYDFEELLKIMWLDRLICEDNCLLDDFEEKIKETLNILIINNQ